MLNGFIGEFLVLSGAFQAKPIYGILGATGVIWSAGYLLWMYQRVFYGKVTHPVNNSMRDLIVFEKAAVWPCAAAALVMGVAPILWLGAIDPAVQAALDSVHASGQQGGGTMIHLPAVFLQTMPQTISQAIPQGTDYVRILPELILSAFGIVVMVLDPLVDEEKSQKTARPHRASLAARRRHFLPPGTWRNLRASPSRTW